MKCNENLYYWVFSFRAKLLSTLTQVWGSHLEARPPGLRNVLCAGPAGDKGGVCLGQLCPPPQAAGSASVFLLEKKSWVPVTLVQPRGLWLNCLRVAGLVYVRVYGGIGMTSVWTPCWLPILTYLDILVVVQIQGCLFFLLKNLSKFDSRRRIHLSLLTASP